MEKVTEYKTLSDENEKKRIERVRALAAIMQEMGLTSLEYTMDHVKMERPAESNSIKLVSDSAAAVAPAAVAQAVEPQAQGDEIKSPMVGTYYSSSGAGKEPFVKVGAKVKTGDVLCIIEAMKMMNEITAERDGTITEVCVENKALVEFGQVLFRID